MDSGWNSRVCAEELRPASPEQSAGFAVVSEEGTQELLSLYRSACKSQTHELCCSSFLFWVTIYVMNQKELCFVCFDKTFIRKGDVEGVPRSHVLFSWGLIRQWPEACWCLCGLQEVVPTGMQNLLSNAEPVSKRQARISDFHF